MDELRTLKDEAARAMGRGLWPQALKLYSELARRKPAEGTWPLRAGDAARKLGDHRGTLRWYERAATTYAQRGFVVRAIAVGKMIEALDPGNDGILRLLDAAQKESKPPPVPSPPTPPPQTLTQAQPNGPPLSGRLSGPPLTQKSSDEMSMPSLEIVFEDVDDGIPIQASDILVIEDIELELSNTVSSLSEEELLERLPSFPLFQVLPRGAFLQVVSQMEHRVFSAQTPIVRQGESGTALYAIIEGEALVYLEGRRDAPLATLTAGDIFGEMALVLDQPRAATVESLTDLELFEMDRELFRDVLAQHPELGDVFSRMMKRRLVENVMATAPLFQQLDGEMQKELMLKFQVREVAAKTKVVEQSTKSDGLYLVLAGKVEVLSDGQPVALLGPGQTFGVPSLLDADHASPTGFVAHQDVIVLRLPRAAFHEVISCYPPVLEHLAEVAEAQHAWSELDPIAVV